MVEVINSKNFKKYLLAGAIIKSLDIEDNFQLLIMETPNENRYSYKAEMTHSDGAKNILELTPQDLYGVNVKMVILPNSDESFLNDLIQKNN